MARITVKGFENLELQLSKLADTELAKEVVWAGAQPLADEIRKNLNALPEDKFRFLQGDEMFTGLPEKQKQDLLDGLGVTPVDIDFDGNTNTKIGFDGYGKMPTKKYPKGVPNQLLARAVESGSSVREKQPFIRPAVNRKRQMVIDAMQQKINEKIT